jgi:hypothetical protein
VDAPTCTKILWIITRDFSNESGNSTDLLPQVRAILARAIYNTDGQGFPEAIKPPDEILGNVAWTGCKEAALKADENDFNDIDPIKYVLFAPEGEDGKPNTQSPNLGITWPANSTADSVTGPVLDGSNRRLHLFAYSKIDQRQAMDEQGLGDVGLYPIILRNRRPGDVARAASQRPASAGAWAWILFVAAILAGCFSMVWIYGASEIVHNAANGLLVSTRVQPPPNTDAGGSYMISYDGRNISDLCKEIKCEEKSPSEVGSAGSNSSLEAKVREEKEKRANVKCLLEIQSRLNGAANLDTKDCNNSLGLAWKIELQRVEADKKDREQARSDRGASFWNSVLAFFGKASDVGEGISLFGPLVLTQLAIILLIVSAGLAKQGHAYGSFVDERNRVSLSSVQQLLWTIVLFGGVTILGVFNIALLADFVRDASQEAAVAASGATAEPLRDFIGFFPSMDPALWGVLGVTVVVSPYLSKRILASKERGVDGGGLDSLQVRKVQPEPLDRRESHTDALWTDLFTGETTSNADNVDVSRLQHLVITGLLLGGYLVMLVEYARSLDAAAIYLALLTGSPVFASMPPVDGTFLGLLAISHSGYLAFKALPQTAGIKSSDST